jgi:hypothetical protein
MNAPKLIIGVLSGLLLCASATTAQELLQIRFNGRCLGTNDSGQPIREVMNNKTILEEYAAQNSITNLNSLALVYAVDGDERGDVIAVANAHTGEILSHLYGLFFSMELPSSASGNQFSRFAYLYNSQQSYEMGSAMLSEKVITKKKGDTNRIINGDLQFYLTSDGSNSLRLCTANINVAKAFTLTPTNTPSTNSVAGRDTPR